MGFFKGKSMLSLLSYGEILVDFLPDTTNAQTYIPLAGGAPANVAVAYAKLGGSAYFAGGISEDNFGDMLMHQLTIEGINTSYVKRVAEANTALVLVSLDNSGERSFNFYRHNSADTQYSSAQIDEINWQDIGIFHYCSNTLTSDAMYNDTLYAIEKATANKVMISFDVNLRQQLWHDVTLLPNRVETCISKSDIVKLSKDEAIYLAKARQCDIEAYGNYLLTLGAKLILITDGANAVQVIASNYSTILNVPRITPVDTTAAGDSFIAGFLFYLRQNTNGNSQTLVNAIELSERISSAVLFGAKCGAFTCQQKGAFTALPSLTDL